jgi:predicted acyl esterase
MLGAAALLAASGAPAHAAWGSYDRPATYGVVSETGVPIAMPDGTVLSANIHRPDRPGRYPVLLFQTPYGSNGAQKNDGGASDPYLVQRGYVQVAVKANEPMQLPVEVFPTNALIRAGHRLRVTVASGDFPHQLPPLPTLAGSLTGTATILTDPEHPSSVTLPALGSSCTFGRLRGSQQCRAWPVPGLRRAVP